MLKILYDGSIKIVRLIDNQIYKLLIDCYSTFKCSEKSLSQLFLSFCYTQFITYNHVSINCIISLYYCNYCCNFKQKSFMHSAHNDNLPLVVELTIPYNLENRYKSTILFKI